MLENQRTHNLYFFNTVTFTLAHLNRTIHQQTIFLTKVQTMKYV